MFASDDDKFDAVGTMTYDFLTDTLSVSAAEVSPMYGPFITVKVEHFLFPKTP
jgi:hypothetical protein